MIHQIKISNQFFDDVQSGKKNFELRKDDIQPLTKRRPVNLLM